MTSTRFLFDPLRDHPEIDAGIWLDRHWHTETAPAWSRAPQATLAISAKQFPEPVPVLMQICVFGASLQTPRALTVSSTGHTPMHLSVRTSEPIMILTTTPIHAPGADHSPLFLRLDALISPARIGVSADERLLGLQIVSLRTGGIPLSWPLDFNAPDHADGILRAGWAACEPNSGAWSLGDRAELTLPGYLRPAARLGLALHVDVLTRPEGTAPLEIDLGGNGTEGWQPVATSPHLLWRSLEDWHDNTDYTIVLKLREVLSPQDLDINSDPRPLGVLLRRIEPDARTPALQTKAAQPEQQHRLPDTSGTGLKG